MKHRPRVATAVLFAALIGITGSAQAHVGAGIAVDSQGRVYFIDTARNRVWRVEPDGGLTLLARGVHANALSVGPDGTLRYPPDTVFLAADPNGSIYRSSGHRILRVAADGSVEVTAGDSLSGYRDGPAPTALFNRPLGLAVDSAGNVYVADYGNRAVRKIAASGEVTTLARTPWPWRPAGVAVWGDRVYALERWGDYYSAPAQILSIFPFFADLVGDPRVRAISVGGKQEIVAAVGKARTRLAAALALLVTLAGVLGWRGVRRRRRGSSTLRRYVAPVLVKYEIDSAGGAIMPISITSSVFEDGGTIPVKYTCDAEDVSPPLKWTGVPEGTGSLALISDDPDAPVGTWVHWVLYNLPAGTMELPEGVTTTEVTPDGASQGINDFRRVGYGGPCPPPGKPHRYFFKLYALDSELDLGPGARKEDVLGAMEGHVLGEGQLMGKYGRK